MASEWPELGELTVGIWGFGREGTSLARMASAAGARRIEAVDDAGRGPLDVPGDVPRLEVHRGAEHLARLRDCDVVFVSPGVPWRHPVFDELRTSGPRISSAADWFVSTHYAQTIGVTGTKGKSTTAAFLGHLLTTVGVDAIVAGNIGTPLSDLTVGPATVVVAEISSQQAALLSRSPSVAIVTNLYEDHLDWHGDTASYHRAKANLFVNGARTLITTPDTVAAFERVGVTRFPELRLVERAALTSPADGTAMSFEHNVVNGALAVEAAAVVLGRPITDAEAAAARASFAGLPHRLQTVRVTGRTRWIDDTLATTGESVVVALRAMRADEHVALIVGGMDRALNYDQVDEYLCSRARRVTLIQCPTNGTSIGRRYAATHPDDVRVVDGLDAAVRTAAGLPDVDVVLLSPGAASYDLFTNYEAKGAHFCALIDDLVGGTDGTAGPVGPPN